MSRPYARPVALSGSQSGYRPDVDLDLGQRAAALMTWVLRREQYVAEPGLTTAELELAERTFGLTMPPAWRAALMQVHPVEIPQPPRNADGILTWTRFPDWRLRDVETTSVLVARPVEGLLFDVEHNDFWWHSWGGARPDAMPDRLAHARAELEKVPRLTPMKGHQYVAGTAGSPIFSIQQADLYIPAVAHDAIPITSQSDVPIGEWPIGDVPFWSELHAYGQYGHVDDPQGRRFGALGTGGL